MQNRHSIKWNRRFIDLAKHISTWSQDPSSKVAAVITENKRIVSVGFNGFPTGVLDTEDRYLDREEKIPRVCHAEANSILFAHRNLQNCTIYVTHIPCSSCASLIIQSGIKCVICPPQKKDFVKRWEDPIRMTLSMFKESRIELLVFNDEKIPHGGGLVQFSLLSDVCLED